MSSGKSISATPGDTASRFMYKCEPSISCVLSLSNTAYIVLISIEWLSRDHEVVKAVRCCHFGHWCDVVCYDVTSYFLLTLSLSCSWWYCRCSLITSVQAAAHNAWRHLLSGFEINSEVHGLGLHSFHYLVHPKWEAQFAHPQEALLCSGR